MILADLIVLAAEAQAASGPTWGTVAIAVLGTGSVAAVGAAIVTGLFSRKKLGADATEIITRAASGVVEQIQEDNARLRTENAELLARVERFGQIVEDHTAVLQLHVAWDAIVIAKMREAGIVLPPAPPVYAPSGSPGRSRATLDIETDTK